MTPAQAIQVLDSAASQASLPRAGHVNVQIAIDTLRPIIEKHEQEQKAAANGKQKAKK
jgi:thiamine pyrophosphate-dependent acetolactate synthase large subunit-like protein